MPAMVHCPHCLYPLLVPAHTRGRARLCRQCGGGYLVARTEIVVRRLGRCSRNDPADPNSNNGHPTGASG